MPAVDQAGQAELALAHVLVPTLSKEKQVIAHTENVSDKKGTDSNIVDEELPVDGGSDAVNDVPTEEELATLRRIPAAVPWTAYAVAVCELAERFSYYGVTNSLTNFIQQPRPPYKDGGRTGANRTRDGVTGALNLGQRTAFGINQTLTFVVYLSPLGGAFVADSYWGRYKTIIFALVVATIGHIVLIIAGIPPVMDTPKGALAALIIAIIVFGIGSGFFKANISPLIAEQVSNTTSMHTATVKKTGERVCVDPSMTLTRIFMIFYAMVNVGALIGQVSMSFAEKYVGFWFSFSIPTFLFLICFPILMIFRTKYVRNPPSGSLLPSVLRIFWHCTKPCVSWNPIKTYKLMKADGFWERAKPSKIPLESRPKWMTFDDLWVLKTRRSFKACQVFVLLPIYQLSYNQMSSNLVAQAATMKLNGTPNQIVQNLDPLAIIILVPLLDLVLYPFLRRHGFRVSALQRMALGFQVGAAAMAYAAVVQRFIYNQSPCGNYASSCDTKVNMNVWIQSGAYILVATSELLVNVPAMEYAYSKAPVEMKSFINAVQLFTSAISAALGQAFSSISQDPDLVENYGIIAGLCSGAGVVFWLWFYRLDKQEEDLNNLEVKIEQEGIKEPTSVEKVDEKH